MYFSVNQNYSKKQQASLWCHDDDNDDDDYTLAISLYLTNVLWTTKQIFFSSNDGKEKNKFSK